MIGDSLSCNYGKAFRLERKLIYEVYYFKAYINLKYLAENVQTRDMLN